MPNGRPGDHPLTDILHYNSPVFGSKIDDLVRVLARTSGYKQVHDRIANLLYENWPYWENVTPDYDGVYRELLEIQSELLSLAEIAQVSNG
jgi:hypothetical protein